ncbi:arginase [Candidatus Saccharibacteria bacterium]|nr:arginase [Candidatus Saccharibacteria bacterium]
MSHQSSDHPITLIGVPLDLGAKNLGVNIGPEAFRHQNIVTKLRKSGLSLSDSGNIAVGDRTELDPGLPNLRYLDEIVRVNTKLAAQTEAAITSGHKVVVIGGDHSVNLGAMSGASASQNGNIGLIYFDAHGDMNTADTTLSGNIHGMHLASLMGFGAPELAHVHGEQTKLATDQLLHVGGSDWDQAELDLIKRENLHAFTLFDLLTQGLGGLITAIDELNSRVPAIWISLDLDCIDQIYAPGAGMPNAKGMTYREIATVAEYIGHHCNVIGVDVVEYNPLQDQLGKTAELGIELIAKFLGHNYSWYTGYMDQNQL